MSGTEILPPSKAGFDYAGLPEDIRAEAKAVADEIKMRMRGVVIEVGAALRRIKDRLGHGRFGKWLSAEFGFTERTAQNYMAAAALVAKYETVSYLQPKTLYQLAAPTTPDAVRDEIIQRFNAGERVADQTVKELISEAKWQRFKKEGYGRKRRKRKAATIAEPPISKEAWHREMRERQHDGATAPPPQDDLDALKALLMVLRGDPGRIADIPLERRLGFARTCLAVLNVTLEDLGGP